MVEPVTTGALLVGSAFGAGAWFVEKVLGPSADAMGQSLRLFLSERISKVFARAEELVGDRDSLQQIPPAFMIKFIQAASFSEDTDVITDLWANLLISSSKKFSNRNALYVDILEGLSSEDAILLDELTTSEILGVPVNNSMLHVGGVKNALQSSAVSYLAKNGLNHFDLDGAYKFSENIFESRTVSSPKIIGWEISYRPYVSDNNSKTIFYNLFHKLGHSDSVAPYDALIRQRLVCEFNFNFNVGSLVEVHGVAVTSLGLQFITCCRGSI